MTGLNIFLLSILYWWGSSTALSMGIGYYTVYRPVVSGMLAGIIMGDYRAGMLAGAVINIIYIDFVSTGGSFKGDQCLTAIIAASAAIIFEFSPVESAAFSYIFGFAGILIWKYRLSINSIFVRQYEKRYNDGLKPNIAFYDGFLPQLLLYFMSTAVFLLCIFAIMLLNGIVYEYHSIISDVLFYAGLFLVLSSVFKMILKMNIRRSTETTIVLFALVLFIDLNLLILLLIAVILLIAMSYDEIPSKENTREYSGEVLRKKDLVRSWLVWMNFSHACYNYERLQGMAFAHSMKNIAERLYSDDYKISEAVHRYADFFNTEPNMGTSIHGFVISLEEQRSLGNEVMDIQYIKKGMMGAAAGLGDSFTQVVLTPLFISLSVMLALDEKYIAALIPVVVLGISILAISYDGWMDGYYLGKESLLKRISAVKKSKIKIYFPFMFGGILGASLAKLIMQNYEVICSDRTSGLISAAVILAAAVYAAANKYKRKFFEEKYGK